MSTPANTSPTDKASRPFGWPSRVRARAQRWQRKPRDESSNSFALLIMLLPLILGAFGIGVDTARNTYIRISLQNDLDLATVGGAAVTTYDTSNNLVIDENAALIEVARIYAQNRSVGPGLSCIGDQQRVPGTNPAIPRCWRGLDPNGVTPNGLRLNYSVSERSRNAFLPVLGITWQDYSLRSSAVLNQGTE